MGELGGRRRLEVIEGIHLAARYGCLSADTALGACVVGRKRATVSCAGVGWKSNGSQTLPRRRDTMASRASGLLPRLQMVCRRPSSLPVSRWCGSKRCTATEGRAALQLGYAQHGSPRDVMRCVWSAGRRKPCRFGCSLTSSVLHRSLPGSRRARRETWDRPPWWCRC